MKELKKLSLACSLWLVTAILAAAQPTLQWQKTIGARSRNENISCAAAIDTGLFVIGGWREMLPGKAPYLLFTNSRGDSLYAHFYPQFDGGQVDALAVTKEGNIAALGTFSNASVQAENFLMLLNPLGQIIWRKDFNTGGYGGNNAHKLFAVPDGFLLLADRLTAPGNPSGNSLMLSVIKTDKQGNQQWQKTYGTYSYGADMVPTPDGAYAVAASDYSGATGLPFWNNKYYLLKLLPNGDTLFTRKFGDANAADYSRALRTLPNGGYALTGGYVQNVSGTKTQGQVMELDSLFNPLWDMKIMPPRGSSEIGCWLDMLQPLNNGNLLIGGSYQDSGNRSNGYVAEVNTTTHQLSWEELYQTNQGNTGFSAINFVNDTCAILTGNIRSRPVSKFETSAYAVRVTNLPQPYKPNLCASPPVARFGWQARPDSVIFTDSSASGLRYGLISKWEWRFGDSSSYIAYHPDSALRVAHKYSRPAPLLQGTPVQLIVTNNLGCSDTLTLYPFGPPTGVTDATAQTIEVKLYPNPMQEQASLELKNYSGSEALTLEVTDILGRPVQLQSEQTQPGQWLLQRGGLSSGLYLYRVTSQSKVVAQGRIIVKS